MKKRIAGMILFFMAIAVMFISALIGNRTGVFLDAYAAALCALSTYALLTEESDK